LLLFTILSLFFPGLPAAAVATQSSERICFFHSNITVNPDASMIVTETISVNASGQKIKRGIYRDFPTRYQDQYGQAYVVDFAVHEVLRDDQPETFRLENLKNGVRVYLGKKEVFLNPGRHTYRITYITNRQIGFFKNFDELYWNVTGNGWVFPIDRASASVRLPSGAARAVREKDAYTGAFGATGKDFVSATDHSGAVLFKTTRRLGAGEGLTIVVSWPKGFVQEPKIIDKARYWFRDNKAVVVGFMGLGALLIYYLLVWYSYGQDPPRGTIIPLFNPPQNLSPASLRFIARTGYDDKTFTAAMINMAVKGYLTIEEKNNGFTLKKTGLARDGDLSPEERAAAGKLFPGGVETIKVARESSVALHGALIDLVRSLQRTLGKTYFSTNRKYFFVGLLISLAILIGSSIYGPKGAVPWAIFMSTWFAGWTFGVILLLRSVFSHWKSVLSGGTHRGVFFPRAVVLTLFAIPFVLIEMGALTAVVVATSRVIMMIFAAMVIINLLFFWLLRARTPMGRKLMDSVEGFKMYLATAEKDRLNLLNPPDRTPALFEKYLPYALALDVEQEWSEQFSDILARAYAGGTGGYTPDWYQGTNWRETNFSGFASSVGASLASVSSSAASSSSSSPGSSSGGGGHGSSGGGGGGGGGGGW
jgi:uncharacterized membrane protein YgcG